MHLVASGNPTFQFGSRARAAVYLLSSLRRTQYFVKCGRLRCCCFFRYTAISDGRFYRVQSFESTAGRLFGAQRNWHASKTGCYDARGMLCEWPTELQSRFHTPKCGTMRRCCKPFVCHMLSKALGTCFKRRIFCVFLVFFSLT